MAQESRRNLVNGCLGPPDLPPFGSGVLHATTHAGPNHRQFELAEHACHLKERFTHGVGLTGAAIKSDAPHDNQTQPFGADDLNDLTEPLRGAAAKNLLQVLMFPIPLQVLYLRTDRKMGDIESSHP